MQPINMDFGQTVLLRLDEGPFTARSWLRVAAGDSRELLLSPGAVLWVKGGHLGE